VKTGAPARAAVYWLLPMFKPAFALILCCGVLAQSPQPLRPPAAPLVVHDPYFSIWATGDTITSQPTRHWTGAEQPLTGLIRIDGTAYRYLGSQPRWAAPLPVMKQTVFRLTPTQTQYTLEAAGVRLEMTFFTPALPHDLEVLSRPVTYLIWKLSSTDGKSHAARVYLDVSSYVAVNRPEQRVMWSRQKIGGIEALRMGHKDQAILARSGDDLRIEWGYFYLAVPPGQGRVETLGTRARLRAAYAGTLDLPDADDLDWPVQTSRDDTLIAAAIDVPIPAAQLVEKYVLLAYDDLYSIEYFNRRLRPYWRRDNKTGAADLLRMAVRDFAALRPRSDAFDAELTADLVAAGGPKYAALAILAYRQTLGAHKLAADFDGSPLYFSKENFSNGCIATVDITYPSAPFFLLLNPGLLKAQVRPILDYARSPRWPWAYAPHDLGQYPLANGQVYGGGEESEDNQMPVEESGNMLILLAALARAEGSAGFSGQYWSVLTKWADYLAAKGMDPDNQLSTDDFAGHLAHNTNLSIKAIEALASYGRLAEMLGKADTARKYLQTARDMAKRWPAMADDGDHFRLAFDKAGTWSQKYNLVWDKLLGFALFDPQVAAKELAYYKKVQNVYGVPLDNRSTYTKLDWIVWSATMAGNRADFETLVAPVFQFANDTPDRVPLSDWYWTLDARQRGFQARAVVGGVFIKMLENPSTWDKWARRAR